MLWEFDLTVNRIDKAWPNGRGLLWVYMTQRPPNKRPGWGKALSLPPSLSPPPLFLGLWWVTGSSGLVTFPDLPDSPWEREDQQLKQKQCCSPVLYCECIFILHLFNKPDLITEIIPLHICIWHGGRRETIVRKEEVQREWRRREQEKIRGTRKNEESRFF